MEATPSIDLTIKVRAFLTEDFSSNLPRWEEKSACSVLCSQAFEGGVLFFDIMMHGTFTWCGWILLFLAWQMGSSSLIHAQNIVSNPSFETYTVCPPNWGNGGVLQCSPWQNGNLATADYFNTCAVATNVWIPDNFAGSQTAHTGNAYVGCYMRESSIWREYVQAPLTEPCVAGFTYVVSFYVSRADLWCGVENIGAYLSATPPPGNTIGTLNVTPQIEANLGFISEADDWVLISDCFTAQGGELWITIGNFYNNANTPLDPNCSISFGSYYYIDDVSVVQGDPGGNLELELGDPVTTCVPYEIDPGVTGVEFQWSDGSSDPTLVVTETGTYFLTITAGCDEVVDSVEITFIGAPPVNIEPAFTNICEGETLDIQLDPAAGTYIWQDGTIGPEYSISTAGLYQVTLNDGCDLTTDEITVTVNAPPSTVLLGNDTILCIGDALHFSFDPDLGDFLWQDGSTLSNYTINGPGTYALTVSNSCGTSSDDIIVNVASGPSIDIGPPSMVLCDGEEFVVQLDPLAGEYLWQDGSTTSTYSIAQSGLYSVTLTNDCGTGFDDIVVEFVAPPVSFTLGNDTLLCDGNELEIILDPELGDFLWQDNSTTSNYTISTSGIYSLTISNSCGDRHDDLQVLVLAAPDVELGPSILDLCEGQQIIWTQDPAMGQYIWQDGSTVSSYTVTQAGTYAVTVSNACGMDTDQVQVEEIGMPAVELGEDITVCPAQLPILLDPGSTGLITTFLWQDQSTGDSYTVTTAGLYSVTVSNSCFSLTDQMTVTVANESPVVQLPMDLRLCQGDSVELSVPGLFGQYTWQDGSVGQSLWVNNPGTYSLTVSNACGVSADTVLISYIDTLLTVQLGPDFSLCPGDMAVLYADVLNATFIWQDMSTSDSLMVTSPGIYFVIAANGCKVTSDTIVVDTSFNPPDLQLVDTIYLCSDDTVIIDAGVSGVQFQWSTGAVSSSIPITSAGAFALTISNTCGMDADTIMVIPAGSHPEVILPEVEFLCNGDTMTLWPALSGADHWFWQNGSHDSMLQVTSVGWIVLTATNDCGSASDSVYITVLPEIPAFSMGPDTVLCPGMGIQLNIDVPDVDIIWSDGSDQMDTLLLDAGLHSVTISNTCGSITDSMHLDFLSPAPVVDLGPDQLLCPGEQILFDPQIPSSNYVWQNGSIDSFFICTTPGWIALIVSNACGLSVDSVLVTEDAEGPHIDLGPDLQACDGETILLEALTFGVDYLWQDGTSERTYLVSQPGAYILQVSNACGFDADTIHIEFLAPPPSFTLGPDKVICPGTEIVLMGPDTDGNFIWQDGSHTVDFIADQEQTYWLEVVNECGTARDSISVLVDQHDPIFSFQNIELPCEGLPVVLQATQDFQASYAWSTGEQKPEIEVLLPGQYTVTVSTLCSSTSETVMVLSGEDCDRNLYIPNVFSPNGDQVNDVFQVALTGQWNIQSLSCAIYDRWGNQVFYSREEDFAWDGRFHHEYLLPGVYAYLLQIEYHTPHGLEARQFAGDVTLIR